MNNLLCCFSLLIFSLEASTAAAQTTPISGIVNRYTAVTGIDTCTGKLSVSDTAGFRPGAAILLIQMQGAEISSANNFLYGIVQNMNYAGRFERAVIDSVALNAIFVQKKLVYTYDIAGKLQAVTLPQYNDAAVNDTLRCQPWNGSTGGILALEASGTLTLDAPVLADGAGFRGGAAYTAPTNSCNFLFPETAYFYAFGNWRGSYKGEGIALPIAGKEFGRGPQANGGGGGNDHNSGGGGGANIADGGNGGDNDEPGSLGCDGYYPGVRGYGIFFTPGRLFPGGGGGAGHSNNALTSAGGHGGGIIFIQAGDIAGNAPVISANGLSAPNTNGDGAGGGGAGGTIWLNAGSAPANLIVSANGGNGGNTLNNNQNRCFGPGGGGSGGRILSNLFGINSPSGGQAGLVANSTNSCNGTSNGATGGDAGFSENTFAVPEGDTEYLLPQILANPTSYTACSGKSAFFSLQSNTGNWGFQWQVNDGTGWQNITGGNYAGFTTDSLVINNTALAQDGLRFRCLVQKSGCTDLISGESTLTVIPAPSAGFSASINGYVADFSNQSAASSFYWQFGDGGVSLANSPQHTYTAEGTYTVTLYAIEPCDTAVTTQTIVIALAPTAGFFVPDTVTGCSAAVVDFDNNSSANATSYQWSFPGGNPGNSTDKNPSITYTNPGAYTTQLIVFNTVGSDTVQQTFVVQIADFPTAGFAFTPFPGGVIRFNNQSQQATSYTWDFGDGTPSSGSYNVDHQYNQSGTYTVTLIATSPCGVSILQQNIEVVVSGVAAGEPKGLGRIHLFPNPVSGQLTVDCSNSSIQPIDIQIFSLEGKLILPEITTLGLSTQLNTADWPAGVYRIVVRFETGQLTRTVVKR